MDTSELDSQIETVGWVLHLSHELVHATFTEGDVKPHTNNNL